MVVVGVGLDGHHGHQEEEVGAAVLLGHWAQSYEHLMCTENNI